MNKKEIVVANLSCNSSRDPGPRANIVNNLKKIDPDLLFAGDQTYHHTEHTWIELAQFREIMKDRPTITIPDDHDIGQANLWGEYARKQKPQGPSGGYYYPLKYVSMVERQQAWHLPDTAYEGTLKSGLSTYFTRLRVEVWISPSWKTESSKVALKGRFLKWALDPIILMTHLMTEVQWIYQS